MSRLRVLVILLGLFGPAVLHAGEPVVETETTWRTGDVVVVWAYCDSMLALRAAREAKNPAGCRMDITVNGIMPIAALLLQYVGAIDGERGGWFCKLDGADRAGFISLPHSGGPHLALVGT
ncbi:MAG: hypothetical protein ACPGVG_13395 [Mycobacterium sp.]